MTYRLHPTIAALPPREQFAIIKNYGEYRLQKMNEQLEREVAEMDDHILIAHTKQRINKKWWDSCKLYTLLAIFIITIVGFLIFTTLLGVGVIKIF